MAAEGAEFDENRGRHRPRRRTTHRGLWVEFHHGVGDFVLVAALAPALIAFGFWAAGRVGYDTPAVWATIAAGVLLIPGYPMDLRRIGKDYRGFGGFVRRVVSGTIAHAWEVALVISVFLWILRWITGRIG
jgi:hypothetical protein